MSSELKQIARQDLWIVDHPQRMPGGWRMDTRMSVLRLPDGALWLHSVVPIDDALAAQLDALGPVRHLVAPNLLHHLYLGPAQQRWPEAHTWAPPGLSDKRPELRIDHQLAGRAPPSWGGVIERSRSTARRGSLSRSSSTDPPRPSSSPISSSPYEPRRTCAPR